MAYEGPKKSNLERISGLWKGVSKAGKRYMKSAKLKQEDLGKLMAGGTLMLFENTRKESGDDTKPDYEIFVAPPLDGAPAQSKQNWQKSDKQKEDIPW